MTLTLQILFNFYQKKELELKIKIQKVVLKKQRI